MELSTQTSPSSKQTSSLTPESTSCCRPTPLSSTQKGHTMKECPFLKSQTSCLNLPTKWPNATPDTASTWRAHWCTVATSCLRTSVPLFARSRPREQLNLWTGVRPGSKSVSTTNPPLQSLEETWLSWCGRAAWSATPQRSPRSSHDSTINSTSCTQRELSSIGTWARAWRKGNFPRPVRIWQHYRKITMKLGLRLSKNEGDVLHWYCVFIIAKWLTYKH